MNYWDSLENRNLLCNPEWIAYDVILKLQNTDTANTELDAFPEEP
jgi:hypothetical protein